MAQNQNPGQGNPMGVQGNLASLMGAQGGQKPGGFQQLPPQGAPGQGPGGGKPQQIAGLPGGPKPSMSGAIGPYRPMGGPPPGGFGGAIQNLSSQGGAAPNMASNLASWAAQRGPKNPNAPQQNMPGMLQTQGPSSLGSMGQAGAALAQQGQGQNANAALLQGRKMMGQGAPGQGAGGNKNQQMATLPGGPR